MTIGMKKDEVIKLLKLSWDWSGRFSRCQYATVSVIVFLLPISGVFILLSMGIISDEIGLEDVGRLIGVVLFIGLIILRWALELTMIGATIRRFHDLDKSGLYALLLVMTVVGTEISTRLYEYPLITEQLDTDIPGWDVLANVIILLGLLLWLYLLFGKGKEIGKTRWG